MLRLLPLLLLALCGALAADLIEPNAHPVGTYAQFVNLGEYPDASFYIEYKPIFNSTPGARYPVTGDAWMSINGGYKFDSFYLVMLKPGQPEAKAYVPRYNYLPDTDPRNVVRSSYRVAYYSQNQSISLEEVGSNESDSPSSLFSAAVVAVLLLGSAAAIWKIKGGRV